MLDVFLVRDKRRESEIAKTIRKRTKVSGRPHLTIFLSLSLARLLESHSFDLYEQCRGTECTLKSTVCVWKKQSSGIYAYKLTPSYVHNTNNKIKTHAPYMVDRIALSLPHEAKRSLATKTKTTKKLLFIWIGRVCE